MESSLKGILLSGMSNILLSNALDWVKLQLKVRVYYMYWLLNGKSESPSKAEYIQNLNL